MKTKSRTKLAVVLVLAAALFAALSPAASAQDRRGDEIRTATPETEVLICVIDGANHCLIPSAVNWVTACVNLSSLNGKPCPVADTASTPGDLTSGETRVIELSGCVGIASCNDFIATCAGGGGTPHTVVDGKKGQPLVAICV